MKQETIKSPIVQVPFADLYVSELNPRSVVSEDSIAALAENIRQFGLIQNLAGLRDDDDKVAIVAGGRRLRALALLQDDQRFTTVAVQLAPDAATAEVWATSENHHREQPHAADEIREYGNMAARGASVAAIAMAFGVTEPHVYRRLKLAGLPAPVLDALKAGEISLGNAAAFTVSEDEKRSLEVLEQVRGEGLSDYQIKQKLKAGAVRDSDRRAIFVGQEAYEAVGGRIASDLFGSETYFDDAALLTDLFAAKLAEATETLKAEGWKWAEVLEGSYIPYGELRDRKYERVYPEQGVLTEDQSARYDELAELNESGALDSDGEAELAELVAIERGSYSAEQKAIAGVLCYVDHSGELQTEQGLVKKEDQAAAVEAGLIEPPRHSANDEPKPAISQALREDLNCIRQGVRQDALLDNPDLVLALLAYQLSHDLYYKNPLGLSTVTVPNWPTTEADGYSLDARLTENGPPNMLGKDLAKSFRAYFKKGREHHLHDLVRFLASHYTGGDELLRAEIDKRTSPDIRKKFTPTATNFFKRVNGDYLNDLWRDLLDLPDNHPTATSFTKLKKAEKADKLEALFRGDQDLRSALAVTDEQAAKIDTWLPEGME